MISRRGAVHLVGAGPGDPELMTLRGLRLLHEADVVVHDRLIPTEVLQWCRGETELIDVGKYPDHHRISQAEINELIVRHALEGRVVVRLKGGDPFVFGRGQEEIEACRNAGVPVFVVPGVSSSIAAPAAAGIPVTTRGIARSFAVVTGQTDPNLGKHTLDFDALSRMDTLILLMARKNLESIVEGLLESGLDPSTPAASIENATCENQQVAVGTLADISAIVERCGLSNPMVTVIGDVASLANQDFVPLPVEIKSSVKRMSEMIAIG
jgi:uroporphyrin-III C-methyltransferase